MKNKTPIHLNIGNCLVYFGSDKKVIIKKDLSEHPISGKSFQILQMLSNNQNEIVNRDDLLVNIWYKNDFWASRSMDVFVTKLRNIFKKDTNIKIECQKKVGLKLKVNNDVAISN